MPLTRGLLLRHFQGRKGGFFPAMLDVAQDHLLAYLHQQDLFDLGLVFKGGTSLRKMRAGVGGRFSTDLDFCGAEPGLASLILDAIDGAAVGEFSFTLANRNDVAGRADLTVTAPFGPNTDIERTQINLPAKIELSPRRPWLAPQVLPFLPLPVHSCYDLAELPTLPVVRVEEAIAEKLARYARVGLGRDLFDLVWYGRSGAIDQELIRYLWVLKVYNDVVIDSRWSGRTFDPTAILTQPTDIAGWEAEFRGRYTFLTNLTDDERHWATCQAGRRYEFAQLIAGIDDGWPKL